MATVLLCARHHDDPRLPAYADAAGRLGLDAPVSLVRDGIGGAAQATDVRGVITVGRRAAAHAAAAARHHGVAWHDEAAVRLTQDRLQLLGRLTATGMSVPRFAAVDAVTGEGVERLATIPAPWRVGDPQRQRVGTVSDVDGLQEAARTWVSGVRGEADGDAGATEDAALLVIEPALDGPSSWVIGLLDAGALRVVAVLDVHASAAGDLTLRAPTALGREAQAHLAGLVSRGCAALGLRQGPVVGRAVTVEGHACLVDIAPTALQMPASTVVTVVSSSSLESMTLEDLVVRHAIGQSLEGYALDGRNCSIVVPGPDPGIVRRRPDPGR